MQELSAGRVTADEVGAVYRAEFGRAVSVVAKFCGDLSLAEDSVQDAFAKATVLWPERGMPPSPPGWVISAAKNLAVDKLRRETRGREKLAEIYRLSGVRGFSGVSGCGEDSGAKDLVMGNVVFGPESHGSDYGDSRAYVDADSRGERGVPDERLSLIFTCCHPALSVDSQVALSLRLLAGLTTKEIARAFLVPEATMGQRISRAKSKIRDARIPYRVPSPAQFPDRLGGVLGVIYLVFNEGYLAASGNELCREDLCEEGIRMGRVLCSLMPDEPEAIGLLALMILIHSRFPARVSKDGTLVLLAEQDRSLWNRGLIEEGQRLVALCLRRNMPGTYQIQAAIAAVHSDARDVKSTDWAQILALYDQLSAISPGPVVQLNRTVALGEAIGPQAGLDALCSLVDENGNGRGLGSAKMKIENFHLFHAVRADFLRRLGNFAEAARSYDKALGLVENGSERAFLEMRKQEALSSAKRSAPHGGEVDGSTPHDREIDECE